MIWTILLAWFGLLAAFVARRIYVTWGNEPDFSEYETDFASDFPLRYLERDASQFRRLP